MVFMVGTFLAFSVISLGIDVSNTYRTEVEYHHQETILQLKMQTRPITPETDGIDIPQSNKNGI